MVEVFKTNVTHNEQANFLIKEIDKYFLEYNVNFDLNDCDKILRVKCDMGIVQSSLIIALLENFGFTSEILSDDLEMIENE